MNRRKTIRYDPANDLYVVLGVSASATAEDLRRSFRQRAKEVHPDVNPDNAAWAHQQFQRLNEAYDILADPGLRAEYDAIRVRFVAAGDNIPWWDKPHPASKPRTATSAGPAASAPRDTQYSGTDNDGTIFTRATSAASRRYGSRRRKRGWRLYHYLFACSMLMLLGSVLTSLAGNNVSSALSSSYGSATSTQELWMPLAELSCSDPRAMITDPLNDSDVPSHFSVRGTAAGDHFLSYQVDIAPLTTIIDDTRAAPNWQVLEGSSSGNRPVLDGLLVPKGVIPISSPGIYMLRLTVNLNDGKSSPSCERLIHLIEG